MKKLLLFDLIDRPLEIKSSMAKDLIYSGQIKQYIDYVGIFNHTRKILISSEDCSELLMGLIGEIKSGNISSDSCQLTKYDGRDFLVYQEYSESNGSELSFIIAIDLNDILEEFGAGSASVIKYSLPVIADLINKNYENNIILDNIFDLLTVTDENGVFIRTNAEVEEKFGLTEDQLLGKSATELEKSGVLSKSITLETLKQQKPISSLQTTQTGKRLLVESTPIFDLNGRLSRIINISKDLTTEYELEQKLEEAESIIEEYEKRIISPQPSSPYNEIVSSSAQMKEIMKLTDMISDVDSTILIEGETGVGKGLLAESIHKRSSRCNEPFVKVNCGSLPETLLESELFGYTKGAFTGALAGGKEGLVSTANGGTLFLDEIGDLPLNIQIKLLDLIQNKTYFPVGSTTPRKLNVRLITATNKDLSKLVKEGSFRADLFYRLNVVPIYIPPLRMRRSEIPTLTTMFLHKFCNQYGRKKRINNATMQILQGMPWPGNIRELENVIERLVVTTTSSIITPDVLAELNINRETSSNPIEIKINELIPLKEAQLQMENTLIEEALKQYDNVTKLSEILGVHRTTLSRKIHSSED